MLADSATNDGAAKMESASWTCDEAVEKIGWGRFQWLTMLTTAAVWSVHAMQSMSIAFLLPMIADEWALTRVMESTIAAMTFLGMGLGAFFWGRVADRFGRRRAYLYVNSVVALFSLLSVFCFNYYQMVAVRFLLGFGLGGGPVSFSLFAELVPLKHRGRALTIHQGLFWSIGAVLEAAVAWITLSYLDWRWMMAITAMPMTVILLLYFVMPETPRYLVLNQRADEAIAVLKRAAEMNGKRLPAGFTLSMADTPSAKTSSIADLFHPSMARTTLLLWIIWGVNVFAYFGIVLVTPEFFGGTGNRSDQSTSEYLDIFLTSFSEIPGIFMAIYLVDRIGRIRSQCVLFVICGCSLLALSISGLPRWMTTFCVFLARGSVNGTFAGAYVYTTEVYPTSIRASGIGTASAIGRGFGVMTAYIANIFNDTSVTIPIIIFGISALVAAVSAFSLPIETKGRQLMDTIDESAEMKSLVKGGVDVGSASVQTSSPDLV